MYLVTVSAFASASLGAPLRHSNIVDSVPAVFEQVQGGFKQSISDLRKSRRISLVSDRLHAGLPETDLAALATGRPPGR